MEVGYFMMLILKKCMRQTVRRDGSPPNSSYIIVVKKKPIRLHLLIHSVCAVENECSMSHKSLPKTHTKIPPSSSIHNRIGIL
jgi:hypothetical protein